MEQIIKTWCPKCQKANYNNNGDPEDFTKGDLEAVRCWNCKHCYPISEEDEDMDDESLEDLADDGKETC